MRRLFFLVGLVFGLILVASLALAPRGRAWNGQYRVISLVANEKDLGHKIPRADHIDPHLANGWGLAYLPTSPFWVTDELTGFATIYTADGTIQPLVVTIPLASSDPFPPGCPTGIAANPFGGFMISKAGKSASALFIFATLDGTISGWNPTWTPPTRS